MSTSSDFGENALQIAAVRNRTQNSARITSVASPGPYFKYLVGVFGFDPDASATTPVASVN